MRALTRCADTHNEATLLEWAESCTGAQLEKTCSKYRRVLRYEGLIPVDDPEFRYVRKRETSSGRGAIRREDVARHGSVGAVQRDRPLLAVDVLAQQGSAAVLTLHPVRGVGWAERHDVNQNRHQQPEAPIASLATSPAKRVVLVGIPGCMTSAITGSIEVFAIASLVSAGAGPTLAVEVAAAGEEPVLGFGGLVVPTTVPLTSVENADAVILPPVPGDPTGLIEMHAAVIDRVRGAGEAGAVLGAACTGTFLLAETGVLKGRRATATPDFRDVFQSRYPDVRLLPSMRVVDEGAVVTAGVTTSYLDLVLSLIGRWFGPRVALQTARILSTDPNPRP